MKTWRIWFCILMVAIFLGSFGLGEALALDFNTTWGGKWLKLTIKNKGYAFDGNTFYTASESYVVYLNIKGKVTIDEIKFIYFDLWEYDDDSEQWKKGNEEKLAFRHIAGDDLDFVCSYAPQSESEDDEFRFIIRITGKLNSKDGTLKSVSVKSVGGFAQGRDDEDGMIYDWVGGLSISGSLVAQSKLPFIPPSPL